MTEMDGRVELPLFNKTQNMSEFRGFNKGDDSNNQNAAGDATDKGSSGVGPG